jgi:hypothetical protein
VSLYLLDLNVLQAITPGGDGHVAAWLRTVRDDELRVSSVTFFEKRRGWERERRKRVAAGRDTADVDVKLAAAAAIEAAYKDRHVPLDTEIHAELARLLGAKDKNLRDTALAATARVYKMVVVTRNVGDFVGRDVDVLNPFEPNPEIKRV